MFPAASSRLGFLAGPDEARLADLQGAFDDPSIDGIWALRGGYGTLRILDPLSLERQRHDPIPFIGFSDNTTLHVRHASMGIISFHGPHPGGPFPPETEASFRAVLFAGTPPGTLLNCAADPPPRTLVQGRVRAPLWGGNLALLAALCGSREELTASDRILFLEDVGEQPYRVDRMLVQLERAAVLTGIAAIAFGRFSESPEGEDEATHTVLKEWAERLVVPAIADLPFGHVDHNCTIPMGGVAVLDADEGTLTLAEPAVRSNPSA